MFAPITPLIPLAAKRCSFRRRVQTPCYAVVERDFSLLAERTLNVSHEGVLVETQGQAAFVGESVLLSLKLPGGTSWIDAQCSVARVLFCGDNTSAIGLKFEHIDTFDRAILQGALFGKPMSVELPFVRRDYASHVARIATERVA